MTTRNSVEIPRSTERTRLDELVARVREQARAHAKLTVRERITLARSMHEGFRRVAERSVIAACRYKGIELGTPQEGEEWLAGPWATIRGLRLTIEALEAIARTGTTPIGRTGRTVDGRVKVDVYPNSTLDKLLFPKVTAEVHFEAGATPEELEASRARFYKQPDHEGKVCLVLGAGNVNSIPPLDVVSKMFNEGKSCILKMNPVNGYVGPFIEEAFAAAIDRGFLAVVYGGGEEGAYLCQHPGIDEIHITGSDKTHDLIVWGPPGPERAARMARNEPLLKKEISSELGNVSPVLLVPGPFDAAQLASQAENIGGAVTNNASFNCNAAKMLVTAKGWAQRDQLLDGLVKALGHAPVRQAYYPGAAARYAALTEGKTLRTVGAPAEGVLPWTLMPGLDPEDRTEKAFSTEPFCAILSETAVGGADPVEFLERAVTFANERLWGTLAATIVIHPATLKDPKAAEALERAIVKLRYGAVAVNLWPGAIYGLGVTPWGAHPSSPLTDIQGGRGFVHNSLMLERVEKTVARGPLVPSPKLPWFTGHRTAHTLARRLTAMEGDLSWLKLPGVIAAALRS